MAPERIDQLNEGLRQLATAAHEVSEAVGESVRVELAKDEKRRQTERRSQRRWTIALGVAMVPILVLVILSVVLLFQSRQRGIANRDLTRQNGQLLVELRRQNQTIIDCTTPGRPCYDAGQKRTAAVLQQVVDSEVVVAQCARQAVTDTELRRCVAQHLADLKKAGG